MIVRRLVGLDESHVMIEPDIPEESERLPEVEGQRLLDPSRSRGIIEPTERPVPGHSGGDRVRAGEVRQPA